MKFTAEQMKKINEAKTAEELIELAKAEGVEMSEEVIKAKFAEMHQEGELADNELNNVAGGFCYNDSYDDNKLMRIRIKDTNEEYNVIGKGSDWMGQYVVTANDDGTEHGRVYYGFYEIVATGASISF